MSARRAQILVLRAQILVARAQLAVLVEQLTSCPPATGLKWLLANMEPSARKDLETNVFDRLRDEIAAKGKLG